MAKHKKSQQINFIFRKHRIHVIIDKVLFFRVIRRLHGRFWGLAGICLMIIGFTICFLIRPDLLRISTALSDFGNDTRTASFFAVSVFLGAFGLWRWRNYLAHTWKRTIPVTGLITITVLGLYMTALMPISWKPWPYRIHVIALAVAGISMVATVVLDGLLSKTRRSSNADAWRLLRFSSICLIVIGGWLTLGSSDLLGLYQVSLIGEAMMLAGYGLWIGVKTYQGEGNRSALSKLLKNIVLID